MPLQYGCTPYPAVERWPSFEALLLLVPVAPPVSGGPATALWPPARPLVASQGQRHICQSWMFGTAFFKHETISLAILTVTTLSRELVVDRLLRLG
jgi:hypothetical protein